MSRVLSRGNKATELRLMEWMKEAGISGWRRQVKISIKGMSVTKPNPVFSSQKKSKCHFKVRPDFIFRRERLAIFVDGCFWHGCPVHGTQPRQNENFWKEKIARNQKRDRKVTRELRNAGWGVLRVWECALTKTHKTKTISRVSRILSRKRGK